jgi:hypothetical protein
MRTPRKVAEMKNDTEKTQSCDAKKYLCIDLESIQNTFFLWLYSPIQTLAASMKLSVSLQLLDLGQPVGLLGRVISPSQGLYLHTNTEKRTHNTNTTLMPRVGFEPMVPASERAKTVHALDRAATVTG